MELEYASDVPESRVWFEERREAASWGMLGGGLMGRGAARQRPGEEPRRIHQRDCRSDPSPPPTQRRHKHNNDNPQLSGTNQTLGNYGNYGVQKLAASGIPSSKWLEVWNVWLIVGPIDFPH